MIYQYLFWSLIFSILFGLFLLFMRGWEGRHDRSEDSYEAFKFGLLTVFAIPYVTFVLMVAIACHIYESRSARRFHKSDSKSP